MPLCLALRSFIEPADCSSLACVLESGTPRIFANERGESLLLGSLLSLDVDKYIAEMINCFYVTPIYQTCFQPTRSGATIGHVHTGLEPSAFRLCQFYSWIVLWSEFDCGELRLSVRRALAPVLCWRTKFYFQKGFRAQIIRQAICAPSSSHSLCKSERFPSNSASELTRPI